MYQLNLPNNNPVLFDGDEAALEQKSFSVVAGDGMSIPFSFASFAGHPLHTIKHYLSGAEFETLLRDAGFKKGMGIIEQHINRKNLELHYFAYSTVKTEKPFLVLIAFGEISPGRYAVHFEGVLKWIG